MKKSAMLKRAKKHLWDGSDTSIGVSYICYAIGEAQETYANVAKAEKVDSELCTWIAELLSGHPTYCSWLRAYHPELAARASRTDLQVARHAWLDWMIKYWQERGE